ncbi:MAG TPA: hypothetical protein VK163_01020, partial [Opitutaceae bacterium]|nr:hypothetical protein [Opitutaceae bacterium]
WGGAAPRRRSGWESVPADVSVERSRPAQMDCCKALWVWQRLGMRNGVSRNVKVFCTALHVIGILGAAGHLSVAGVVMIGSLAAVSTSPILAPIASLGAFTVVAAVFGAVLSVAVASAVALVVEHTARTAVATEELADSLRRLELEKTRDDGFYYRVR